jgi:hypothetical protein
MPPLLPLPILIAIAITFTQYQILFWAFSICEASSNPPISVDKKEK